MRAWQVAFIGLAFLLATGCGANARYASLALEDENRRLEDMVYQKQAELERAQRELETCRAENQRIRSGAVVPPPVAPPGPAIVVPPKPGAPDTSRPPLSVEMPSTPSTQIPDTLRSSEAPKFQATPKGAEPGPSLQIPGTSGGHSRPEEIPAPLPLNKRSPQPLRNSPPGNIPSPGEGSNASPESARVKEITLNDTLTGGTRTDPQRGDQGITLVVEPRDERGSVLQAPAPVSVVVLDPAASGSDARVARWDFTAEQVAASYRKGSWGEGYWLEMLWPAAPPRHEQLQLFVRYQTSDGRKLEGQQPIRVAVAGRGPLGANAVDRPSAPASSDRTVGNWQQRPGAPSEASSEPLHISSRPAPATRPTWSPIRQ